MIMSHLASVWALTLLSLLVSNNRGRLFLAVRAQEPQDVHPLTTECLAYGCFLNWFCAPSTDFCIQCPNAFMGTTTDDCVNSMVLENISTSAQLATDFGGDSFILSNFTSNASIAAVNYYSNATELKMDLEACISSCVHPQVGEDCTDNNGCDPGRFFCDYETPEGPLTANPASVKDGDDDVGIVEEEPTKQGICKPCKQDIRECLDDPSISSPFSVEECVLCDVDVCIPLHYSVTEEKSGDTGLTVASNALQGSPSSVATGPLVSCSNLIYREELTCVAGGNSLPAESTRQDGMVCLVEDYTHNAYYVTVVNKCAELGGVAVVFYEQNQFKADNETWTGSLSFLPTTIPSVSISYDNGKRWEDENLGKIVQVNVTNVGDACFKRQFCSDDIPCVGASEGQYCDYKWGGGDGGNGYCRTCPEDDEGNPDPLQCFFNRNEDEGAITGQKAVEDCAKICASSLTFPTCKFCPQDISGFDFGLESQNQEKCRFCPENDILYPDKEFPLFGNNIKCWQIQKFFDSVDVNADARNCQLAQMNNYVCGCNGSGYLGASSDTKKKVLAWLPRVMAILSIIGSTFIIYDCIKSPEQRQKAMNQLLIGLSIFDLIGAFAYAFTTLPIPEDHEYSPIYGAKGNAASCTTQGFFIQMGTISAYMNVSLAIYYLLVIKYSWDERRIQSIKWAMFLCPMVVGFVFAFVGIPYYDSLNLWCNNTASYWPDIPVAVAIGLATVIMSMVCWDVYSKEKASAKWRDGGAAVAAPKAKIKKSGRTSLSSRVFWQSFFYLMSFYLTWPAYLGLQYAWAGGSSFTNYGLILTAATLVPLQG